MRRILCGHGHQTKQYITVMNEAQYYIVVSGFLFQMLEFVTKKKVAMLTQQIEIENRIKIYKNILLFTVILLSFCLFIKQQTSIFPNVIQCNFLCKVIFPRT